MNATHLKATIRAFFWRVRTVAHDLAAARRRRRQRAAAIRELSRMPRWRLADVGIEPHRIPEVVDALQAVQPSPLPAARLVESPARIREAIIDSELAGRAA